MKGQEVERAHVDDVPEGFAESPSGLIVPTELAREREVLDANTARLIVRGVREAARIGVRLIVGCDDDRCSEHPVIEQIDTGDGGMIWRCGHKDRVIPASPFVQAAAARRGARALRRRR